MKQTRERVQQEVETINGDHYYVEYDVVLTKHDDGTETAEVDWKTFSIEPVEVTWYH